MWNRHKWSQLNTQQVGTYTEYFVKMELTMYGFQVYTTEVDDHGIDFVARHERGSFIEVQVKSLRVKPPTIEGYVFLQKDKFIPAGNLYLALGLLADGKPPELFLIPSSIWEHPNGVFVSRDYPGLKSKPEWGINISKKNAHFLDPFKFEKTVASVCKRLSESTSPMLDSKS
jgi:hypothetical protein